VKPPTWRFQVLSRRPIWDYSNHSPAIQKVIEGGKALAENAQDKFREVSEKPDSNEQFLAPPPPLPLHEDVEVLYYFLDPENTAQGPVKLLKIKNKVKEGELMSDVLIAAVGSANWTALSSIDSSSVCHSPSVV
jgi:hypothetical protein